MTAVMWFRRDLRLADNPALLSAIKAGGDVVPLFVLDDRLRKPAGAARLNLMYRCLRALAEDLDGALVVRAGSPADVVAAVAAEAGAEEVFCAEDFGPYGRERDDEVEARLANDGRALRRVGSPYAVVPGTILKTDGSPFKVFSPFARAWRSVGWARPQPRPQGSPYRALRSEEIPADHPLDADLLPAGEAAALERLEHFLAHHSSAYGECRNSPGAACTSRLSGYLKYGCVHPRQVLQRLGNSRSHSVFRDELCWREFYGDVLYHQPESKSLALQPKMRTMELDEGPVADARFRAWAEGKTGYPIVDAGMRQLAGEAYVHNRVRMIVASFLIKDLHIDWTLGAKFFMEHLQDGDLASNAHGWQWVAGTGTDAAPYFRIFNPTSQAEKFDPDGEYIRRWIPELRNVDKKYLFEPWKAPGGPPNGYPEPVVVHAEERAESLRRYAALRG